MTNKKERNVYFIGAGPGDPGFLTLHGQEALEECVCVYAVEPYPVTFSAFLGGKEILDPFEYDFDEITWHIETTLKRGSVAFLVPGDMTVFSPFLPLVEFFGRRARVIAGVGTMNAAAALLKKTLNMPGVSSTVLLTSPKHLEKHDRDGELSRLAAACGTMVLFMNNRPLDQLVVEIGDGFPGDTPVAIVYRAGLDKERIYDGTLSTIADIVGSDDIFGLDSGKPSLAIVIIGQILKERSRPGFWDKRKRQFWDREK